MEREHRKWMYNKNNPGRRGLRDEFVQGVGTFIAQAKKLPEFLREGTIRCPCVKCKCVSLLTPAVVKSHLYKQGFMANYYVWTVHGETNVSDADVNFQEFSGGESSQSVENDVQNYQINEMVRDALGIHPEEPSQPNVEQSPNDEAKQFYEQLEEASRPLYEGSMHSKLSVAVRLLCIKTDYNISQAGMNSIIGLMNELNPNNLELPSSYYDTKKLTSKLGLSSVRIDCCEKGCMLFYKDDAKLQNCKFCELPRFKEAKNGGKKKKVPIKAMHYLPLIPRLKRLYASMSSAPHMRWHAEHTKKPGILRHPSDGEAWKHFDRVYPEFAKEPRNIRLGLCADGFTPFSVSATPYSCWPVFVTPYNLPPEMCMTSPYLFLTCIIPGPHNPKSLIDVYLQPLIDELKLLWDGGVETYDISTKQNFSLHAALMWTINDFPAYGMLSGWSTGGKLGCPCCMEDTKAFTLKHGGKNTWFDCHRRFLPMDHEFRRNTSAFMKNRTDFDEPPQIKTGEEIWARVRELPKVTETPLTKLPGYGVTHNWTKQSIFWELPYWKNNLLRHNLDPMHIEKNYFDAVFHTVMDVKNKTKDNLKARMDLEEHCRRKELHLQFVDNKVRMPKASYTFELDERREICEWVKNLRMPDGYASNISRCVDMKEGKLTAMKSHDCHIFMENLLPIAFGNLPDRIWKPITEMSLFFKDLCSNTLKEENLALMNSNVRVTTNKMRKIFPPGFFNVMEHLPIHLAEEARLGGPVQCRWMYPFEREIGKCKRSVNNRSRIEGSICEAYLAKETSHFCSYYFEHHVPSLRNRPNRHDEGGISDPSFPPVSIFNQPGRGPKTGKMVNLNEIDRKVATTHVLLNCPEVQPFYSQHGGRSVIPPSSNPSTSTSTSSTPSLSGMHIGDTPSPSTDPSTPLSSPVRGGPTQYLGDIGEQDESHRLIIAPDGNSGFIPSHKSTNAVTDSMKPFYVDAWRSWKEIPWDVRDNMWRHFQTKCVWHPSYDNQMCGNFERKAQERLKGTLSAMHRSGKKPDWVLPDVWTKLNVWWDSPEFKAKSEQGKAARASEKGGSLHTGGSRSVGDHHYRMEQDKGRAVSFDEVFEDLHRFKRDGKLGAWVEQRAEATHVGFKRRVEEWYQSHLASEVGSSIKPTLEEMNSLFIEEVGGPKKGRTYGLRSQYSSGPVKSGLRPTPCSSSQNPEVVDALQRKVEMMEEQRASDREQLKLLQEERASDRAQLSQLMDLVKDLASKHRYNRESNSYESD